jgi:hypothetical protein
MILASGCAFTPKPVFLLDKTSSLEPIPPKNLKLALIVNDTRPDTVKALRMCGLMRNTYMVPTSFAFLTNTEPLDKLTAYHVKKILENAGFSVTKVSPEISTSLSEDKLKEPPAGADQKTTMKSYGEITKSDRNEAKDKKEEVNINDITGTEEKIANWISPQLVDGVDGVVQINIDKYSSDVIQAFLWVSVQGWSKFKVTLSEPIASERKVLWGKAFTGYGTSGPRQLITEDCYMVAVNMSHWIALREMEKVFRSEEFLNSFRKANK